MKIWDETNIGAAEAKPIDGNPSRLSIGEDWPLFNFRRDLKIFIK